MPAILKPFGTDSSCDSVCGVDGARCSAATPAIKRPPEPGLMCFRQLKFRRWRSRICIYATICDICRGRR